MRISIKYFLYTDGDYCLDNAEVLDVLEEK